MARSFVKKLKFGICGISIDELKKIEQKLAKEVAEKDAVETDTVENDTGLASKLKTGPFTNVVGSDLEDYDYVFDEFNHENNQNYQHTNSKDNIIEDDSRRTYRDKTVTKLQNWAKKFATCLFGNFLKYRTVLGKRCSFLGCSQKSIARCRTCITNCWFCSDHAQNHCVDQFHVLVGADGNYIGTDAGITVSMARNISIVLISHGGWVYDPQRSSDQILEEGFWFPLTPERPSVFVHFELMEAASQLYTSTMTSVEAIVKFVEAFFSVPPPMKWRENFGEALKNYSALKMMINHGKTSDDFINGRVNCRRFCPACFGDSENSGTVIMGMGGCFSFKHHDGHVTEIGTPIMAQSVFYDAPNLNDPINSQTDSCREFKAGVIKRKQNEYCDVSGVFGGICVQGIVFGLMNIERGESLNYSIQMTSYVRKKAPKSRIIVAYDLFCKISSNKIFKSLADGGFIPSMHAINHIDDCRGEFDPSRMLGIGIEYGEDSERGWSVLNKISAQTSVMRNENREEIISIAVDNYNDGMIFNLVNLIKKDLKVCKQNISDILGRITLTEIKGYFVVEEELSETNNNIIKESTKSNDHISKFLSEVKYYVRRVKSLRRMLKKKVGATMVQELHAKINDTSQKLRNKLSEFNSNKAIDEVISEESLFHLTEDIDLKEPLRILNKFVFRVKPWVE